MRIFALFLVIFSSIMLFSDILTANSAITHRYGRIQTSWFVEVVVSLIILTAALSYLLGMW